MIANLLPIYGAENSLWTPVGIGLFVFVLIATVAIAGFLVYRLIRTFRAVRSKYMPLGGKLAFWASLAYTLFPLDILPDPILVDDIGIMGAALYYINYLIQNHFPDQEPATGSSSPEPPHLN